MKLDHFSRFLVYIQSVWLLIFFVTCSSSDTPAPDNCTGSTLDLNLDSTVPVSACTATDGMITVTATGGAAPYQFKLDNESFIASSNATFIFDDSNTSGIGAGAHTVSVKDNKGCIALLTNINVDSPSDLDGSQTGSVEDSGCNTDNGSVTITATGGTAPYDFDLNAQSSSTNPATFSNLKWGDYTVTITDSQGCIVTVLASVDPQIDYDNDILPIFQAKCQFTGCHPTNGNWFDYNTAKANASLIKTKTGDGTMPKSPQPGGSLTAQQIANIACWVDNGAPKN